MSAYAPKRPAPAELEVDWSLVAACVTGGLLVVAIVGIAILAFRLRRAAEEQKGLQDTLGRTDAERQRIAAAFQEQQQRFRGVVDADAERQRVLDMARAEQARLEEQRRGAETEIRAARSRAEAEFGQARTGWEQKIGQLRAQLAGAESEFSSLQTAIAKARAEWSILDEEANLRSFGFYKPRYDLASSERYQAKLDEIRERQKQMLKDKAAAVCPVEWSFNGSLKEGKKQISQTLKLMLRAFNGECDAAVAKVNYKNVQVMETRIRKACEAINEMNAIQQCSIVPAYVDLKLAELYLVHEYQEKLQAEKDEQRRIREQMREEEAAQRELERARQEAEREEQRAAEALRKAREEMARKVAESGANEERLYAQLQELERRLGEAHQNKERVVAQAQLTRAGHVYVISNIGSFGEHVYKIGMTRRFNPMERVEELGDASVPFEFDVHAMIWSNDAPALETALHRRFDAKRVNKINQRKEFFRVKVDEVAAAVYELHGEIEITRLAEAEEYRKTVAMEKDGVGPTFAVTPGTETPAGGVPAAVVA